MVRRVVAGTGIVRPALRDECAGMSLSPSNRNEAEVGVGVTYRRVEGAIERRATEATRPDESCATPAAFHARRSPPDDLRTVGSSRLCCSAAALLRARLVGAPCCHPTEAPAHNRRPDHEQFSQRDDPVNQGPGAGQCELRRGARRRNRRRRARPPRHPSGPPGCSRELNGWDRLSAPSLRTEGGSGVDGGYPPGRRGPLAGF